MFGELFQDPRSQAVLLLFFGSLGLMAAILVMLRVAGSGERDTAGRVALLHWLPIAMVALMATVLRQPELGIAVALGTSVAALSSVSGFVLLAGPMGELPPLLHRVWLFLPVPVLLTLVLGFEARAGLFEAATLALQGLLLLLVWSGNGAVPPEESEPPPPRRRWWMAPELLMALGLALLASWATARGAQQLSAREVRYPPGVLGASLISATLALPMISVGTPLAAAGRARIPLTAQTGVVFLNIGLLLPLVLTLARVMRWLSQRGAGADATADPVLFSRMAWRIDTVALLILAMLFVPAAAGRLRLDRWVGGCLVAAYFIYLTVTLVLGPLQSMQ